MPHVITQTCCNDAACVAVCPVNCIHPTPEEPDFHTAEMLYIDPAVCIDCGSCAQACPIEAIYLETELPDALSAYGPINADFYADRPAPAPRPALLETPRVRGGMPPQLRVAIVGAGPAGFYAAERLLARRDLAVSVNMIDRLPTPFGLIRAGVAPDHAETKTITDSFAKTAEHPRFRYLLGVEVGTDVTHAELLAHHHAVLYTVGALSDRALGIPGEELPDSRSASEFVAWYNGHPDYADRTFDLTGPTAVVIGNGNVAIDIARILVTSLEQLATTDIADHALDQLRHSGIGEVVLVGRRGPAQAAFTFPELLALTELPGIDIVVDPADLHLDEASARLAASDPVVARKLELLHSLAQSTPAAAKRVVLRFTASPIEIYPAGVRLVDNQLQADASGRITATPGTTAHELATTLVIRSIGFQGNPLPELPFDAARGIIPNEAGRVTELPGSYVAGWIKRGPTGTIGTNRQCANETVASLLDDLAAGRLKTPGHDRAHFAALVASRQPAVVDADGWHRIDHHERDLGRITGRPRRKLTSLRDLHAASGRS
jgi:ferredoxin--NADP+ reductase